MRCHRGENHAELVERRCLSWRLARPTPFAVAGVRRAWRELVGTSHERDRFSSGGDNIALAHATRTSAGADMAVTSCGLLSELDDLLRAGKSDPLGDVVGRRGR